MPNKCIHFFVKAAALGLSGIAKTTIVSSTARKYIKICRAYMHIIKNKLLTSSLRILQQLPSSLGPFFCGWKYNILEVVLMFQSYVKLTLLKMSENRCCLFF